MIPAIKPTWQSPYAQARIPIPNIPIQMLNLLLKLKPLNKLTST